MKSIFQIHVTYEEESSGIKRDLSGYVLADSDDSHWFEGYVRGNEDSKERYVTGTMVDDSVPGIVLLMFNGDNKLPIYISVVNYSGELEGSWGPCVPGYIGVLGDAHATCFLVDGKDLEGTIKNKVQALKDNLSSYEEQLIVPFSDQKAKIGAAISVEQGIPNCLDNPDSKCILLSLYSQME